MGKKKKSEAAELLEELATLDEVEAYVPTGKDHDAGAVPEWCELVMTVKRGGDWPLRASMPLRRHDGELIIEVLDSVLHPNRGGGAADMLWRDLDAVVDRIQRRVERGLDPRKADVIEARVLSTALAYVQSPYEPDVDLIKDLAMQRYETRNGL